MEVVDRLLPVITLLLGAWLTWLVQRAEAGRTARLAAGELVAEVRKHVWTRGGEEDWLNLQVFLGRLRVHLTSAGVPAQVVRTLTEAAEAHWNALEEDPEVGWLIRGNAEIAALGQAEEVVYVYLNSGGRWWRRSTRRERELAKVFES